MTTRPAPRRRVLPAIQVLGYGVLRLPETEGRSGAEGMVALHHPATEQRLGFNHVLLGGTGTLVAVLAKDIWPGLEPWPGFHATSAVTVSIALARGKFQLECSGAVGDAADLAGCAPRGRYWRWLDHAAATLAADRDVRLEIHRACTCARALAADATPAAA